MTSENRTEIAKILAGIGDINEDKVAEFDVDSDPSLHAFRYIKRPLHRDHEIMVEGVMIDLPSLIPLVMPGDDFHDSHNASHPCRTTFKSIIRLLRSLVMHNINLETDEEGVHLVFRHCHYLTDEMKRIDPEFEHAIFGRSDLNARYALPAIEYWGKLECEEWMMGSLDFYEEIRFLAMGCSGNIEDCDGRAGAVMERTGSKARSMLEKMGYLEREDLFETVSIALYGIDVMLCYLKGQYKPRYQYRVVKDIPSWWSVIPNAL
jgi:hypothetical protein